MVTCAAAASTGLLAACSASGSTPNGSGADSGTDGSTGGSTGGPSSSKVRIGASLALSGSIDTFASGIQNGVKVAEDAINQAGGVLGSRVQVVVVDDKFEQGAALNARIQPLIDDEGVGAIIGPLTSGQVFSSFQNARDRKIPFVSPSATALELSGVGDGEALFKGADRFFFRTVPSDDLQAKAVAKFAYTGPGPSQVDGGVSGCRRMGIIHANNSYGKGMAPLVKAAFEVREGVVALVRPVAEKAQEFVDADAVASQVLNSDLDCQVLIMYEASGGLYMKALVANAAAAPGKLKPGFFTVGTDGLYAPGFYENGQTVATDAKSANATIGVYGTNPDTNPISRSQFQDFESLYRTKYSGQAAASYTANVFDAVVLVALAYESAGTSNAADGVKIRDALRRVATGGPGAATYGPNELAQALNALRSGQAVNYQGASGDVDFEANGTPKGGFIVWRIDKPTAQDVPGFSTITRFRPEELER